MNNISWIQNYWNDRATKYINLDEKGWSAICFCGAPVWYNKFLDYSQKVVFLKLINAIEGVKKDKILDVGCGIGRWTSLLSEMGAVVIGIDFSEVMIQKAKEYSKPQNIDFRYMDVCRLEFPNNVFDLVSSVTVLQHLPLENQEKAIKELCRITKKGGYILIIEATDMKKHRYISPREPIWWKESFKKNGCEMVKAHGQWYIPLLRFMRLIPAAKFLRINNEKENIHSNIDEDFYRKKIENNINIFKMFFIKTMVNISYPIESICIRTLPIKCATHVGFLFKKDIY